MTFTIWDYILPTAGVFAFSYLLVMIVCAIYFITKPKAKKNTSLIVLLPGIVGLTMIVAFLYAFSSVRFWGNLLDAAARASVSGTVEDIQSAGRIPLYYDRTTKEFCTASFITISGAAYYLLTDQGIDIGDSLVAEYCTEGNTVLSWAFSDESISAMPTKPEVADHTVIQEPGTHLFSATGIIVCLAFALALLLVFERPISQKRIAYLREQDVAIEGLVVPQKISPITCLFEMIVSLFAVLSFFSDSKALFVFLTVCGLCLWGIKLVNQQTYISYQDDSFLYMSLGVHKTYLTSDIRSVEFVATRQRGCKQLCIRLNHGITLRLEQMNFSGLEQFYH